MLSVYILVCFGSPINFVKNDDIKFMIENIVRS
jgi:hypothetical protein